MFINISEFVRQRRVNLAAIEGNAYDELGGILDGMNDEVFGADYTPKWNAKQPVNNVKAIRAFDGRDAAWVKFSNLATREECEDYHRNEFDYVEQYVTPLDKLIFRIVRIFRPML